MSIKSSISDFFKVEELKENVTKLVEAKIELKKLEVLGKAESLIAKLALNVFFGLILLIVFIFLNILIGLLINHFSHSTWIGFVSVFIFYILLFLIVYLNKETFAKIISAKLSETISKEEF